MKKFVFSVCAFSLLGGGLRVMHDVYGTVGLLQLAGVKLPEKIKVKQVEKLVEVEKPRVKFEQALAERMKTTTVPAVIVEGVLMQEDGSRSNRMSLTRYEDDYMRRQIGRIRTYTNNSDEQRLWASSWCPFQIMALEWVKKFDLDDWTDLLDPETCAHVGISILEDCWKNAQGRTTLDKVYALGICYNGPLGQKYAERLVAHVQRAALNQVLR